MASTDFIKEIDMFFAGKGQVQRSMRRLARQLAQAKIVYAIADGMAVNAHGHERMTKDVDVLLTKEGLDEFRNRFVPHVYQPVAGRSRRFVDPTNDRTIDILLAGMFPGDGRPGPIPFPNPDTVRTKVGTIYVIDLHTLITLKLCARRHQDFADVASLIRVHNLDETYLSNLHQDLHCDFIECLEEKRREDDYQARE